MITPKISIIVPVYKAEKYLHKCVDSLLAQNFTDFEVLLIDDGSPDKSGKICDEYAKKDSRVRVFHKENGGVSSARQLGLDNALGEYVIHTDPDDWVESTMLEELYNKAKEEDADMVICDYLDCYTDKTDYVEQRPSSLEHTVVLSELFQQLHGSCWNKLVRRACYSKYNVRFDLELSWCEDLLFNISLLLHSIKISYLPKAFYHYTHVINTDSITANSVCTTYDYNVLLYNKLSELLNNSEVSQIATDQLGLRILTCTFNAHVFTSKEYETKCRPYVKHIRYGVKNNGSKIYLLCLLLSCYGFYETSYRFYNTLRKIHRFIMFKN